MIVLKNYFRDVDLYRMTNIKKEKDKKKNIDGFRVKQRAYSRLFVEMIMLVALTVFWQSLLRQLSIVSAILHVALLPTFSLLYLTSEVKRWKP